MASTFKLATLLRVRENARDQRRGELAEAYRVDDVLRARQEQLLAEQLSLREGLRRAIGPGRVKVDTLLDAQRYELALKAHERQLAQQRGTVAEEIERRRLALVEANREVRVLEKLRAHKAQQAQAAEELRERKQFDEIAQSRVLREEVL